MIVCFKNLRCYYNFSYCAFYSSLKIFLVCLVETGFILLLSINLSLDTFELVSKIISAEKIIGYLLSENLQIVHKVVGLNILTKKGPPITYSAILTLT